MRRSALFTTNRDGPTWAGSPGCRAFVCHRMRIEMTTRNDNDQNKAADEAARTARTVTDEAARVGEQTARAGADVFRRSTETARDGLQQGLNTATQSFQRMTDQFTQALGFNGPQSEELTRRSSQNLQAVSQAS